MGVEHGSVLLVHKSYREDRRRFLARPGRDSEFRRYLRRPVTDCGARRLPAGQTTVIVDADRAISPSNAVVRAIGIGPARHAAPVGIPAPRRVVYETVCIVKGAGGTSGGIGTFLA